MDFIACTIEAITGDRLIATGSLRFLAPKFGGYKAPAKATPEQIRKANSGTHLKQIRLCGAHIGGNLDLRGSKLGGYIDGKPVSPSLFADGITVRGNVLLCKNFVATGEICLNGATIDRNLDCSAATLINPEGYCLSAAGARINGSVLLCRPYWREKDDDDHDVKRIFRAVGVVRFQGAKITGDLNCTNSRFTASAFLDGKRKTLEADETIDLYVIEADGLEVGSDVAFGCDAEARSDVIGSEISSAESIFLGADGVRYDVLGTVSMINARVGGDLLLCDTRFHFPGEETVCADGITVTGTTFLDKSYSNAILRFVQATLKQGLSVKGATFDVTLECQHWLSVDNISEIELGGPACGIYASSAQIGGDFTWQQIKKLSQQKNRIRFWVNLFGANAASVEDDEASWMAVDRFDVTSAVYGSITHLSGADSGWRLRELDRQYALFNRRNFPDFIITGNRILNRTRRFLQSVFRCGQNMRALADGETAPKDIKSLAERKALYDANWVDAREAKDKTLEEAVDRFKPQPYLHLAKTFRTAGYQAAARKVLVRLERNQTRYSDISIIVMFWRWLLDLTIEYGHALLRPIFILAAWVVVSAAIFENAFDDGKILQFKDASKAAGVTTPARAVPTFNSLIFAIDTLLPIVDLNQKKMLDCESAKFDRRASTPRLHEWTTSIRLGLAANP